MTNAPIVEVCELRNYFEPYWVHENVNFTVKRGEIAAIIGLSGCGKTTVLRAILMLLKPTSGTIKLFGQDLLKATEEQKADIQKRLGMMFQKGALFSSLSVIENVMFPLEQHTKLPKAFIKELAFLKLLMVGIEAKDINKYPSQISGGMQKRVAAARAIALEPELLLLDEPVAGLDPQSAKAFDELLLYLRDNLNITILMVSHDIASLKRTTDKVIFLGHGQVLFEGPINDMMQSDHALIQRYFSTLNEVAE